ncbi:Ubiquitin carboxyl-terminal hydrolase of the cysteine proteinase fold protein [Cryptosporidium hominis]|uniref:ubiquitinyl hydrolase 1 n=2 Tax=Cryptosporidium hominis TaxID=237895 RepID=A0ABX5BIN6_CRYHO|nr:Ubiquitin carboxyl-terminal hydrolase of the cysteine proteinase fold protein [Cryptosporidium hominis]|eukprot:PPS98260.1 Ubiquitin carboxyl-terminal hydrolase of the cysteine proteinase fold protein [Cryptosporidium hominis]
MASILGQEAEKRQDSHPVTLQLSNRLVNFVSGGFLANKTGIESPSYVSDNSQISDKTQKHMDKLKEKEQIENNVPLAKPEYYYFPPELLTDARDFLEPKEISQFRPYGRGLANPGWNTCYFNSILQALTYAPYLSIDCLRRNHQKICKHMKEHLVCIMCMFEDHVNIMLDNTSKSNIKNDQPVVSSFIKCAQKLIWKRFRIGMMHDAQEFLRYFLEALHKSCLPKNLQTDQTFRKIHPIAASTTYIGQLFCGFFLSRIVCHNCQYTSNTYDPFMDVPLDIMGVSNLENALKLFTKIEYLKGENRYMCPKCNQRSDASKQLLIEKLPPLLTIQLKRFSYVGHGSRKPNKAINFSDVLDLQPYISSKTYSESSYIYKLWAVVCHSGNTLSCGHYYTHAKSIDNKWYCFNDDYVKPTRIENVLNENHKAYLLFYYRSDFNKYDLLKDSGVSIESLEKSQIITPLAPEISFINLQLKSNSKSSVNGKNNNSKESSNSEPNLNEFLDQLLTNKSKGERDLAQNQDQDQYQDPNLQFYQNQQNNNNIRLVLNPIINTDVNNEKLDSKISIISKNKQTEKIIKAKICNFKLRSLLLCDNWITRSKSRRNLATIFYLKKLKKLGLSMSYFIKSKSGNCLNGKVLISNINKSQIDTWEDLNLSNDTITSLEQAQKSLLARSNIRSDYDKEYDKGKVKKPLRQAILASTSTNNNNEKNTNSKFQAKKSAFIEKGNIKDLDTLSSSELFDIAFKNKGNLKNKNKRRNVRIR